MKKTIILFALFLVGLISPTNPENLPIVVAKDSCPSIKIYCLDDQCCGKERTFGLSIQIFKINKEPTFKWNVSSGTIIEGQGKWAIKVDATEVKEPLEVSVKVENIIPAGCPNTTSYKEDCSKCH